MDKSRFIEIAPVYYELAIARYFERNWGGAASQKAIMRHYAIPDPDGSDEFEDFLSRELLFDRAMTTLIGRGMIDVTRDEFGPSIYKATASFDAQFTGLQKQTGSPFYKSAMAPDGHEWLISALNAVNIKYDELQIKKEDFETPDSDWEPLPIDRNDPKLETAIEALDDVIEKVRADNGYSATLPEERSQILESLSTLAKKLKTEATISWMYH